MHRVAHLVAHFICTQERCRLKILANGNLIEMGYRMCRKITSKFTRATQGSSIKYYYNGTRSGSSKNWREKKKDAPIPTAQKLNEWNRNNNPKTKTRNDEPYYLISNQMILPSISSYHFLRFFSPFILQREERRRIGKKQIKLMENLHKQKYLRAHSTLSGWREKIIFIIVFGSCYLNEYSI